MEYRVVYRTAFGKPGHRYGSREQVEAWARDLPEAQAEVRRPGGVWQTLTEGETVRRPDDASHGVGCCRTDSDWPSSLSVSADHKEKP